MKRWRTRFLLLVLLCLLSLGGLTLSRVILNDQINAEAKAGDLPAVCALMRDGAGVEGRSIHFKTPLMSAAEGGQLGSASFLLAQGADVNAHNGSGSVLMWAVASGNAGLVRLLIARGADVNWRSDAGTMALQMAKEYKRPALARMLQRAGARN